MNRLGVANNTAYILVGIELWASVLKSGVHATLAGVALAFMILLNSKCSDGKTFSMSKEMEYGLHYWVAFMVLPFFAYGLSPYTVPNGEQMKELLVNDEGLKGVVEHVINQVIKEQQTEQIAPIATNTPKVKPATAKWMYITSNAIGAGYQSRESLSIISRLLAERRQMFLRSFWNQKALLWPNKALHRQQFRCAPLPPLSLVIRLP